MSPSEFAALTWDTLPESTRVDWQKYGGDRVSWEANHAACVAEDAAVTPEDRVRNEAAADAHYQQRLRDVEIAQDSRRDLWEQAKRDRAEDENL